jgi:hypothetical protein
MRYVSIWCALSGALQDIEERKPTGNEAGALSSILQEVRSRDGKTTTS